MGTLFRINKHEVGGQHVQKRHRGTGMVTSTYGRFKPSEKYSGIGDWQKVGCIWDKAQTRYSHGATRDNFQSSIYRRLAEHPTSKIHRQSQNNGSKAGQLINPPVTSLRKTEPPVKPPFATRSKPASNDGVMKTTSAHSYRQFKPELYKPPTFGRKAVMSRLVT